jgi:hypothetical protein
MRKKPQSYDAGLKLSDRSAKTPSPANQHVIDPDRPALENPLVLALTRHTVLHLSDLPLVGSTSLQSPSGAKSSA